MKKSKKVKNMSVSEMASEIDRMADYVCDYYECQQCPFGFVGHSGCYKNGFLHWLNSEAEK